MSAVFPLKQHAQSGVITGILITHSSSVVTWCCVCVCARVCQAVALRRPRRQNVLNKHTHWHPIFKNSHYYSFSLLLCLFYLFIYQIYIIMVILKTERVVLIKGV